MQKPGRNPSLKATIRRNRRETPNQLATRQIKTMKPEISAGRKRNGARIRARRILDRRRARSEQLEQGSSRGLGQQLVQVHMITSSEIVTGKSSNSNWQDILDNPHTKKKIRPCTMLRLQDLVATGRKVSREAKWHDKTASASQNAVYRFQLGTHKLLEAKTSSNRYIKILGPKFLTS